MNTFRSMVRWMGAALCALSLVACGDDPPAEPAITSSPANVAVTAGNPATFTVAATGSGTLSYQWQRNGTTIAGATLPSYTLPSPGVADSGASFAVVVSNAAGTVTSAAATLTVNPPPVAPSISSQPAGATVTAGTAATFSVVADGSGPLSYQWQRDGVNIPGATAASYTLAAPASADSGAIFRVVVGNTAGSVTSGNALLTVADAVVAPSIVAQPQSANALDGSTAQLSVAASGTAPFTYQWRRNGTAIAGATAASHTTPDLALADSGAVFTVVVSNSAGSVTSNAATITVNPRPVAISAQPASVSVTAGQTASFTATATGSAPISYQWRRNGTAIAGATAATYTTPATTSADSGALFTVLVSNAANSVASTAATLTVNTVAVAPSVTTAPASATISEGQTASFSVTAAGTAPLSYQWRRNAVDIAGATAASYTTPATTAAADNGARYSVRISNAAGTVTSADAVLTVNAATGGLIGRAWATGQLLEADDNPVRDRAADIDDQGRVTVVFRKSNGTRDVIYATRGTPNAAGTAPSWSTPVAIDVLAGAPVSTMGSNEDYGLVVTPGGNAVAYWYHNAPCTASTYRTSGTCRYYYLARYTAASNAWSAPEPIGDAPSPGFTVLANDRGDIALLGTSWLRSGTTSYSNATAVFLRNPGEASFRRRLLNTEPLGSLALDMDAAGNLLLAAEYQQAGTTDMVAYRGTVASGLGAPVVLDSRGAVASLNSARVGLNGQQVVVWTQNNGTQTSLYAATAGSATEGFAAQELGPRDLFGGQVLTVDDSGSALLLSRYGRWHMRWTSGAWQTGGTLPATTPTSTFLSCSSARNGNFMCVATSSFGEGNTGRWTTYDASRNVMVQAAASGTTGTGFVLGLNTINRGVGYAAPALSMSGVGFISMQNTFDVLPTPAVPAGDGRPGVTNLWGAFLK